MNKSNNNLDFYENVIKMFCLDDQVFYKNFLKKLQTLYKDYYASRFNSLFEKEYEEYLKLDYLCKTGACSCPNNKCKSDFFKFDLGFQINYSKERNKELYVLFSVEGMLQKFHLLLQDSYSSNLIFRLSESLNMLLKNYQIKDFFKLYQSVLNKIVNKNIDACYYSSIILKDKTNKDILVSSYLGSGDFDEEQLLHFHIYILKDNYIEVYELAFDLFTNEINILSENAEGFNKFDLSDLRIIINSILFLNFVEVETYIQYIKPSGKNKKLFDKRRGLQKVKPVQIITADINYNKTIISEGSFNVSSHFRFQPCGTGRKKLKLILIKEFQKQGYTRRAKKLLLKSGS